jgi:hypothetical protein
MQINARPHEQSLRAELRSFPLVFDLKNRMGALAFTALWLLILVVAVVDGYLLLIHRQIMIHAELNPVGRFLLALDHGNVRYFFIAKCCGTIAASSFLLVLYWTRARMGLVVTIGVALFQFGLLSFLLFGP